MARACSSARFFVVCPSTDGLWIAREANGLVEGLFRSRKDAVRFALVEGGHDNFVCCSTEPATSSIAAQP